MTEGAVIRHVILRGRVQGIGFRAWTEFAASSHGIEGWVRNRRDGTVEALFAGPAQAVEAMIAACQRGPPSARVDAIEATEGKADELTLRRRGEPFSQLATV